MRDQVNIRLENDQDSQAATAVIRLKDPLLRMATLGVLREAGIREISDDNTTAVIITDDAGYISDRTILIVEKSSSAAQAAMRSTMQNQLGGIVAPNDIGQLPLVISSIDNKMVCISQTVLKCASDVPELSERQIRIVSMIIKGESNARIAARLGLSVATIKREVSVLLNDLKCGSRLDLALKLGRD